MKSKIIVVIALITILFSACSQQKNILLSGTIESTQYDVNAEAGGKVIKMNKDEGEMVKQGDVLAEIDSSQQELVVKQYEAAVRLKQAKLDELKAGTRTEQVRQAEASVATANEAVSIAKTGLETAQINYDYLLDKYKNVKSLYESGSAAENDLKDARFKADTAEQQLLTAQKQLNSARSQLQAAQAQLNLLEEGAAGQAIEAAEADLEQSGVLLEQAKLTLSKCQVKSPVSGTYLFKNADVGDMVNAGTSVATISDLTDLWVNMYIPQAYLSLVNVNQEINLKAPALSGKTIKGKIIFIASEAEFTPKNAETNEAKENTVFKLKIKIMDNIDKLKPGMTVEAVIPYSRK